MTIFFFISGFLIAGQILDELDRTATLALGRFYARRALRLYPALIGMVVLGGLAFAAVGGHVGPADVAAALFYLGNYHLPLGVFWSGLMPDVPHPFVILWSLAVEEHYYLVFPFLALLFARDRTRFAVLIVVLILAVTAWRAGLVQRCAGACSLLRVEHGTDTRVDSILFGALLATLLASGWRARVRDWAASGWAPWAGVALLGAALVIRDPWFRDVLRFSVQGVGLLVLLAWLLGAGRTHPLRRVLGHRWLILIGRWSYSLYLWHWVVYVLARVLAPGWTGPLAEPTIPSPGWMAAVFVPLVLLSLAAAACSYYGIERPMLRFRRALGSHSMAAISAPAPPRAPPGSTEAPA